MSDNITTTTTTVDVKNTTDTEDIKKSPLSSILEDNSGGLSSTRILMLSWGIGVLLVWAAGSIIGFLHGVYVFPAIPESVVSILGIVLGGKVIQRFGEK